MQTREMIIIVATLELLLSLGAVTLLYSQNAFAQNSNTGSANGGISGAGGAYASANNRADGTSSGTGGYNSNAGLVGGSAPQSGGGGGGSSGAVIGGGNTGQPVDHHLFCDNIGMITPICK